MPNGRGEALQQLEAIRAVSAFWALVWQVGDLALYAAVFGVFLAPGVAVSAIPRGSASLAQWMLKIGLVAGIAVAGVPAAALLRWALQALSRRQTGVGND